MKEKNVGLSSSFVLAKETLILAGLGNVVSAYLKTLPSCLLTSQAWTAEFFAQTLSTSSADFHHSASPPACAEPPHTNAPWLSSSH